MECELKLTNDSPFGKAGERVTLALQPQDVHDPTELPQYLAGYKPFGYRADEASPPVLVDNDEDKYRSFDSDDAFLTVAVKGSTRGAVPEVDPKSALKQYKVVERYLGAFIPKQTELQTGNNYNPLMAASRRCRRALELDREIDVFGLLGDPANWPAGQTTPAQGTGWGDTVAGNPLQDIQDAITKSTQRVDAIWVNQNKAFEFLRHPEIRDNMRQTFGDAGTQSIAQSVLNAGREGVSSDFVLPGLPPIKVVASKSRSVSGGPLSFVMPDVAVLVTTPPGVPDDGEDIATSWTFRRRGPSGTGFEVRQFFVENRGPLGGTMVVVSQADIAKLTAPNAGGIITGI